MSDEKEVQHVNKYEIEAKQNGKEVAELMSRMVNGTYDKAATKAFVEETIFNTHRTLQQGMFNCFIQTIREAAEQYEKGNYDLRNEASYKWCAEVVEKVDMYNFPCI